MVPSMFLHGGERHDIVGGDPSNFRGKGGPGSVVFEVVGVLGLRVEVVEDDLLGFAPLAGLVVSQNPNLVTWKRKKRNSCRVRVPSLVSRFSSSS